MRQVTHALLTRPPLGILKSIRKLQSKYLVRLACVRHAASVHPEPGSNSPFKRRASLPACVRSWFRPAARPFRGVRLGPGFRTTRFMCLAMLILASQYPVFKVLRRPCGRPALSSFSEAQGDILPNRLPAVKNFFPVSRKSFPGRRSRALSREAGGTGAAPLSRKTQPEYITRPGRSAQGGNLKYAGIVERSPMPVRRQCRDRSAFAGASNACIY